MSIVIALTSREIRLAAWIGCERRISSRERELTDRLITHDKWDADVESAASEMAVHKALDCFWSGGLDTFKKADLGKTFQIRSTKYDHGHLIVRPNDPVDHTYLLITGRIPIFTLVGGIKGTDARQDKYKITWDNGDTAWKVPQSDLRPITEEDRCRLPR